MNDGLDLRLSLECGPLGDVTVLAAVVREALMEPTCVSLQFSSPTLVDLKAALAQPAKLLASIDGEVVRAHHLVLRSIQYEGSRSEQELYSASLAHPLWQLTLRHGVRMFQEMSAKDIIQQVLSDAGLDPATWTFDLQREPGQRVYCVQYRETDFDFVRRLLEEEGVYFHIEEADDRSLIKFCDTASNAEPIDGDPQLPLVKRGFGVGVHDFEIEYHKHTDMVVLRDYNYETPQVDLSAQTNIGSDATSGCYEFPGRYQDPDLGAVISRLRGEEFLATAKMGRGVTDRLAMRPGCWFELSETVREELGIQYFVRSVVHRYVIQRQEEDADTSAYSNEFGCSPLSQPYRPPRVTPIPNVGGFDSVVVTGPSGEEIYTDELGRMKGKFFWDRVGSADQNSSCWMRVLQLPIGGSMALARMNWEMLVQYCYGDPDRPIGSARVDNAVHTAPYAYPTAGTSMALKTMSSPGGGKYNEFSMEDGGGGMKFAATASKDWEEDVKHDKTEKIAVNETLEVGVSNTSDVGVNQTISIGAMLTTKISSNATVNVVSDRTRSVGAAETATVSGTESENIEGADSETVGATHMTLAGMEVSRQSAGSASLTVGGAMIQAGGLGCSLATAGSKSESIGGVKLVASGSNVSETVIGAMSLAVGGAMLNVAGKNCTATAKGASSLTVGAVALANGGSRIQMKAKSISITVGGVAAMIGGGGIMALTPGSASFVGNVTVDASGALKIKGAPNLVG